MVTNVFQIGCTFFFFLRNLVWIALNMSRKVAARDNAMIIYRGRLWNTYTRRLAWLNRIFSEVYNAATILTVDI